jgi:hypothetical protein
MSVTVITPTTGMDTLAQAIKSVSTQNAEHIIVVDGVQFTEKTVKIVTDNAHPKLRIMIVPENTGNPQRHFNPEYNGKFYGHRIYGAMANLVNTDHIMFLDEDNWYEPDHIDSMVQLIKSNDLEWAYSLRKVVDADGNFICEDNCDSLGVYPNYKHIPFTDMNCYCFGTGTLLKIADIFQIPSYNCDRALFKKAVAACSDYDKFGGTGRYTVNYRVTKEGQADWFIKGNEHMQQLYNGNFPWRDRKSVV